MVRVQASQIAPVQVRQTVPVQAQVSQMVPVQASQMAQAQEAPLAQIQTMLMTLIYLQQGKALTSLKRTQLMIWIQKSSKTVKGR